MAQRACDRCHSIRARCQFLEGQGGCERCQRLGHSCTSLRREKRPGRPRKTALRKQDDKQNQRHAHEWEPLQDLDPWEVQMAVQFLRNQRFENGFVGDSDLKSPMQSTPIRLFLSAPGRVKDALLALAGVLASQGSSSNDDDAMINLDRCCRAMERLRQADVTSLEDARATLFVATSLISVNDMTIGFGFLPIARAALLSIEPWYHQLVDTPSSDADPHLIPVLFAEVAECIRCCEVPTLRYGSFSHVIDPSYGVAQEMLPHLYDFCFLRKDLKLRRVSEDDAKDKAEEMYESIEKFNPVSSVAHHVGRVELTATQTEKIVRHGECYKAMIALLLGQLQLQFTSSKLPPAADLSVQLFGEISNIATEADSQIQYLLFPYFVACTELQDEKEQDQVLGRMERLSGGVATHSCNKMYEFLQYVWSVRRLDPVISWFDLVEDGVQFSIGP